MFQFCSKMLGGLAAVSPIQPIFDPAIPKWPSKLQVLQAKLKHVLWLEDLKASLRNCTEKIIYKSSSNLQNCSFFSYFVREFHKCVCQLWFSKVKLICRQIYVLLVGASFLSAVKHNFI